MNKKTNLVIVPCHSIWKIDDRLDSENYGQCSEHWFLAPFQYEGHDHLAFIMHSLLAIEKLLEDVSGSLLLFSGSCTKADAGQVSEAQSYLSLTLKLLTAVTNGIELPVSLKNSTDIYKVCERITENMKYQGLSVTELFAKHISTEEFALDSFDNLLYSLARFHELTLNYPSSVTIVGFGFKTKRFLQCHACAIDYPLSKIEYLSYEPKPQYSETEKIEAYFNDLKHQENKNALELFALDWYGTKEPLRSKKTKRNPFALSQNYKLPLKLEKPILNDKEFFETKIQGKMPWSSLSHI
ncbi:LAQU0S01e06106g1_1 [Lachancea quebecensis]|uniref:LAQU0S01e06106g1_1 n=1 Tax=Lachancea quebecensis TaxID=1654605 RepID=A0A0P1KPB9_9SACH|nr:LAQU0S01e06106g1_1 [Lachancea quebecensis]